MTVRMIGVNHRTAPLALRERLALTGPRLDTAVDALRLSHPGGEFVILNTCNRTEVYVAGVAAAVPTADQLTTLLCRCCDAQSDSLSTALICHEDESAVNHLFQVASGLDSMVLGENQILGQVKRAYESAHQHGHVGPTLHEVFQDAMATAKRVRSATAIGDGRVSVGSVAVDFARQIFRRFDDKVVVSIGAGPMAKLMLGHLHALQPAQLWIANRSLQSAKAVAAAVGIGPDRGGVRRFDQLDQMLVEADIVLTGTGASEPIITVRQFKPLLRRRRHRPLFLIDIAMPRDVEEGVESLQNVYVYNLDDLQRVLGRTAHQRNQQVEPAQALVDQSVQTCMQQIRRREFAQLVKALRNKLHEIGRREQQRTMQKIAQASPDDLDRLVQEHSVRLINKILHLPLQRLDGRHGDRSDRLALALRDLFRLEIGSDQPSDHAQAVKPSQSKADHGPEVSVRTNR